MKKETKRFLCILLALICAFALPLAALEPPAMNGPVNDLAGVLSAEDKASLTEYLTATNDQTGVQVAVLTVKSLEGDSIENFSINVAKKWELGQKDKNNGALLVVAIDERALRIEVGYGLEGTLTDMQSGLIIRDVIVPFFKSGDYGTGITEGAKKIVGIATGNETIQEETDSSLGVAGQGATDVAGGITGFVFFIIFMIIMMIAGRRRRGMNGRRGGLGGLFWGMFLGSLLSGSGRSGSGWGGSSGSGFGGGSSFGGGGGFSGGGGSFGGGGASGGW